MNKFFLLAFLSLAPAACNQPSDQETRTTPKPYFDLNGFFEDQIRTLQTQSPEITKRIEIGGEVEEKTLRSVDFQKELKIFQRFDINKPAWLDQYAIDSTLTGGTLTGLRYTAKKDKLKTREINIEFEGGSVSKIKIFNQVNTPSLDLSQELRYTPGKSYFIDNRQRLAFSKEKRILITASFPGSF